jgi:hypothetical protein
MAREAVFGKDGPNILLEERNAGVFSRCVRGGTRGKRLRTAN